MFFEVVGFSVRCDDGIKTLLDAFCLIKIPRVGCLVLHNGEDEQELFAKG
jgi:hypothetical protein